MNWLIIFYALCFFVLWEVLYLILDNNKNKFFNDWKCLFEGHDSWIENKFHALAILLIIGIFIYFIYGLEKSFIDYNIFYEANIIILLIIIFWISNYYYKKYIGDC